MPRLPISRALPRAWRRGGRPRRHRHGARCARRWRAFETLGAEPALEEALADVPQDLRRLAAGGSLGVTDVAELHRVTGATSLGQLCDRLGDAELAALSRSGAAGTRRAPARARLCHASAHSAWSRVEPAGPAPYCHPRRLPGDRAHRRHRQLPALRGRHRRSRRCSSPRRIRPERIARLLALPFISAVLHASRDKVVLRFDRAELTIHIVRPESFVPRLVSSHGIGRSRVPGAAARRQPGTDPHARRADRRRGSTRSRSPPKRTCTRRSISRRWRRNCARAQAKWKPPPGASCRGCSVTSRSAATCTCTRTGATGATRSRRCCWPPKRSATNTWRSPTIRTPPRLPAGSISVAWSARWTQSQRPGEAPGDHHPAGIRGRHPAGRLARFPRRGARTARRGARLSARRGRTFRRRSSPTATSGRCAIRSSRS